MPGCEITTEGKDSINSACIECQGRGYRISGGKG